MSLFYNLFGLGLKICNNTFLFLFPLYRNNTLIKKGFAAPKVVKTGTTIAGVVYKDGVILGGDTRATEDTIVADKYSLKIHYLAPNM